MYKGALDLSTAETTNLTCTDLLWRIRYSYGGQPPAKLVLDVHLALNLTSAQGESFARFVGCSRHAGAQTGRTIEFVIHPPCTCPGYSRIRDGCFAFCTAHGIAVEWTVIPPPTPARVTGAPGAPPRAGDDDDDDDDTRGNVAPARRAIQRRRAPQPRTIRLGIPVVDPHEESEMEYLSDRIDRRIRDILDRIERYQPRNASVSTRTIPGEDNALFIFEEMLYEHKSFSDMQNGIEDTFAESVPLYIDLFFMIVKHTKLQANAMARTTSSEQERMIVDSALAKLRLVLKARYIAYVLGNMTEQDAMLWFVMTRPFYVGFSDGGTLMADYDHYDMRRTMGILRVAPLYSNNSRYAKVKQMILFVNMAIKRDTEAGAGIDRVFWHLQRLDAVVWWVFCKLHRADYVDVGGGQAIFEEYAAIERLGWERERKRERVRRGLQDTGLLYVLDVKDTDAPVNEEPCVVCRDRRRIVTAVPCMHKITCGFCSAALVEKTQPDDETGLHLCTMCRTPVQYFEIRSETNQ